MSKRTNKLDELLIGIVDDFESMTEEYQNECREKAKSFLIGLVKESDTMEALLLEVEGL